MDRDTHASTHVHPTVPSSVKHSQGLQVFTFLDFHRGVTLSREGIGPRQVRWPQCPVVEEAMVIARLRGFVVIVGMLLYNVRRHF